MGSDFFDSPWFLEVESTGSGGSSFQGGAPGGSTPSGRATISARCFIFCLQSITFMPGVRVRCGTIVADDFSRQQKCFLRSGPLSLGPAGARMSRTPRGGRHLPGSIPGCRFQAAPVAGRLAADLFHRRQHHGNCRPGGAFHRDGAGPAALWHPGESGLPCDLFLAVGTPWLRR
jgi:hypothetical protein